MSILQSLVGVVMAFVMKVLLTIILLFDDVLWLKVNNLSSYGLSN